MASKNTASTRESNLSAGQHFSQRPWARAMMPFVIGGSSGMLATTCLQPVDMVKVRLQLFGEGTTGGVRPNPLGLGKQIIANEGFLSLYNGLSAGLMRQAVYSTARLGFFDVFLKSFEKLAAERGSSVTFLERATASLGAGALGAFIGNPTEVALIRMQSDGLKPKIERANYRSVFDTWIRIIRNEGALALWNGSWPTMIRAMSTNFGQLAFFSESKNQLQKRTDLSLQMRTMIASGIAGFFAAFLSLPFDFMKTRLQRQTRAHDGKLPYKEDSGLILCGSLHTPSLHSSSLIICTHCGKFECVQLTQLDDIR